MLKLNFTHVIRLSIASISISLWSDAAARAQEAEMPNRDVSGSLVQEPSNHTMFRWGYDLPGKSPFQRSHYSVLQTFKSVVGNHWRSTVRLMENDHQLALGVIVDENGWVVSKSSELPDGELVCRLADASRAKARVMLRRADLDLALVKVEKSNVPAANWTAEDGVGVGGFLASTDSQMQPLAIGVVSVEPRAIRASPPVLGIRLEDRDEGVMATKVIEGGGAARAGIRDNDVLVAINGQQAKTVDSIKSLISANRSGDRVTVTVQRGKETKDIQAQLTDMSIVLSDPTEAEVNGQISARASDFVSVFQHDTILTPNQCGGPLVNLEGKIVGLNIARAGRVHSYAIPMDVLVPAVDSMLASATLALKQQKDGDHVLVDSRVSDQLPKNSKQTGTPSLR